MSVLWVFLFSSVAHNNCPCSYPGQAGAAGAPFFQASFLLFVDTHFFGCTAINATAQVAKWEATRLLGGGGNRMLV